VHADRQARPGVVLSPDDLNSFSVSELDADDSSVRQYLVTQHRCGARGPADMWRIPLFEVDDGGRPSCPVCTCAGRPEPVRTVAHQCDGLRRRTDLAACPLLVGLSASVLEAASTQPALVTADIDRPHSERYGH
jgi:hypothetical protein